MIVGGVATLYAMKLFWKCCLMMNSFWIGIEIRQS